MGGSSIAGLFCGNDRWGRDVRVSNKHLAEVGDESGMASFDGARSGDYADLQRPGA